jgi:hypothetical protein
MVCPGRLVVAVGSSRDGISCLLGYRAHPAVPSPRRASRTSIHRNLPKRRLPNPHVGDPRGIAVLAVRWFDRTGDAVPARRPIAQGSGQQQAQSCPICSCHIFT